MSRGRSGPRKPRRGQADRGGGRAGALAAIALGLAMVTCSGPPPPPPACTTTTPPRPAGSTSPGVVLPDRHTIADVAHRVMPSVVSVLSVAPARAHASDDDSEGAEALPFDLPRRHDGTHRVQFSLGSGVILRSDGIILTNHHVVARARQIRVATQDGRVYTARVIGSDPASDIAVLQIDAKGLPAIAVADSSKLEIGDLVLAVGNPFGVGETVTMGIISGLGRANLGITQYDDFIQTDAAINPGNSGGALVDMNGRLVGLNTAILSRTGGYEGIGFAIPSTIAVRVASQLIAHGKVTRAWLGVALQDVTQNVGHVLQLQPHKGVLVSEVVAGSPAERAGLARGDVIATIDGSPVKTAAQARNEIALRPPGSVLALRVQRAGQVRAVAIRLGEQPPTAVADPAPKAHASALRASAAI